MKQPVVPQDKTDDGLIFGDTLDWVPGTSQVSRLLRFLTWMSLFFVFLLVFEAIFFPTFEFFYVSILVVVLAMLYFVICVVSVLFMSSQNLPLNPLRLSLDILISSFFSILSFSLVYRVLGISLYDNCGPWLAENTRDFSISDTVYFSMVTFSTVGYGDFRPCPEARLLAGVQAMLGNLHLAFLVGSGFAIASASNVDFSAKKSADNHGCDQRDCCNCTTTQEQNSGHIEETSVGSDCHIKPSACDEEANDKEMG